MARARLPVFFTIAWLSVQLAGCMRCLHPLPVERRPDIPCACSAHRQNVHVFLVHGLDPLDYANLEGIREHLQQIGYSDSHVYQFHEGPQLAAAVITCREQHPTEPIALVGFSVGCLTTRKVANLVHDEAQVDVDLLFYMGGWFFRDETQSRPPFVPRVVHVLGTGCDTVGVPLPEADNIKVESRHFGSPTNPAVLRRLEGELQILTSCPVRLNAPRCAER